MSLSHHQRSSRHLRLWFDVLRGYSEARWQDKPLFVKHVGLKEQLSADAAYATTFEKFQADGVPTEQERLKQLSESKEWTDRDQKILDKQRSFLETLKKTRQRAVIAAQILEIDKNIQKAESDITESENKKASLMGWTCDILARRAFDEELVLLCLYDDADLRHQTLSREDLEFMDSDEFEALKDVFAKACFSVSEEKLKELALSPTFYNMYCLLDSSRGYELFSRPISELNLIQQRLLSLAKNARYILENIAGAPTGDDVTYDDLIAFSKAKAAANKSGGEVASVDAKHIFNKMDKKGLKKVRGSDLDKV